VNAPATVDLAVVILTRNEEANLPRSLASVRRWAREVFVVDSGSTDATVELAEQAGAVVVSHPFETHARQWDWALSALPITAPWVLALDADQRVSPELRASMELALAPGASDGMAGFYVNRRQVFRGRWIRHGGYYPKYLLKLFRRGTATLDPGDLVDHHFVVSGKVARLQGDLIEENTNEGQIYEWVAKHNRYARLQAREELDKLAASDPAERLLGHHDERMRLAKRLWRRLPLYGRPFLYFGYRYFLRLGFLDGKEGLVFHFMQALWYRLLVDINRDELKGHQPQ
jgi:glycosyltransferase involved in cell wall biosynthesis